MKLRCREREIDFPRRPLVMGIVNINDDSFSWDGTLDAEAALGRARMMLGHGADIIDVGAESARTNREPISEEEEASRLRPFLEPWNDLVVSSESRDDVQLWPPLLSVNTWRTAVARQALAYGADLLNDISGLPDPRNAELCAETGAALVIMHTVGDPKVDHTSEQWDDVMGAMEEFFEEKMKVALAAGLAEEQIVIDPGIEFAKQRDDNLTVFRDLERLSRFGRPVLLPVSRKKVIGEVLGIRNPAERDAGTVACIAAGVQRGAQVFRVHDVEAAASSIKTLEAVRNG